MAQTFAVLRKYAPRIAVSVGASALAFAPAFAQATTPETGLADAIAKVLAIVAVAGAGFIAVALAGVGWNVGAKFIKRMGGKA
jgi:hypothetical protein